MRHRLSRSSQTIFMPKKSRRRRGGKAAVTNDHNLQGIAAVGRAFLFLDGPANVLSAATACHRWRTLATADSVWRAKAVREGMIEKAGVFEVPLPAAAAAAAAATSGEGGSSSGSASAASNDKLAGVGLAFYAQIYVLQVDGHKPDVTSSPLATTHPRHHRHSHPLSSALTAAPTRSLPLGRGTNCWTRTTMLSTMANALSAGFTRP